MTHQTSKVGFVSLGCPKALVDSERILTKLRSEGYEIAADYNGADVVVVNTCGFIDSAKEESLSAIKEAMTENGRVIVTGCLGVEEDAIREVAPDVLAISGPHQYETVVNQVHEAAPRPHDPYMDLVPPQGVRLTPRHFSYVKISEGCNHSCKFCIIPSFRGKHKSRPVRAVLREAEKLVEAGCQELLIISQDTSAYGIDLKHAEETWTYKEGGTRTVRAHMTALAAALGELGVWVRLHYVYPYPHVDEVIPLMAEGKILPYLDIPFQHASPKVLKSMRRPANEQKVLSRIHKWREQVPELVIRSTFIVGFPGETEEDFQYLLDWLKEARLDHVGCFKYEPVEGATANELPDQVPEDIKEERWNRFMAVAQEISREKLQDRIGLEMAVIIDEVTEDGAIGRTYADAPEIDGNVIIPDGSFLSVGDMVFCLITEAQEYDLIGQLVMDSETSEEDEWDW
ncbi:30S ribosomal protein S12 methylthiotransferase RimO [Temperatibacter marinus]|uniref:Ribosomal protein uS12 methylthiotransferase RimO n=1 Tax=Temperatibacter marinus TaxID=1456591 RepID=A0AA52EKP0_9PROT|nr:30S ribosomal protein S12 methylthiotransferase RimO [Temperatibacter marinus]WND04004.1 30S ribosomal protein S12 methylthiotransferase RimO [Temperatibacter marinus]